MDYTFSDDDLNHQQQPSAFFVVDDGDDDCPHLETEEGFKNRIINSIEEQSQQRLYYRDGMLNASERSYCSHFHIHTEGSVFPYIKNRAYTNLLNAAIVQLLDEALCKDSSDQSALPYDISCSIAYDDSNGRQKFAIELHL